MYDMSEKIGIMIYFLYEKIGYHSFASEVK